MTVLLLLIPLSLVLLGVAVWAFIWAVGRGQFDDLDSPALDILVDRPEEQAPGSAYCDGRSVEHSRVEAPRVEAPQVEGLQVEGAQVEGLQGNGHAD